MQHIRPKPEAAYEIDLDERFVKSTHASSSISISYTCITPIVAIADILLIVTASVLGRISYSYASPTTFGDIQGFFCIGIAEGIMFTFVAASLKTYQIPNMVVIFRNLIVSIATWVNVVILFGILVVLLKGGDPNVTGSIIFGAVLGGLLMGGWRLVFGQYLLTGLETGAVCGRRAVIIGAGEEVNALRASDLLLIYGIKEVGRIAFSDKQDIGSYEVGELDNLMELVRKTEAEEVIVAVRWSSTEVLRVIKRRLSVSPIPVRLLPDRSICSVLGAEIAFSGGLLAVELQRAPLDQVEGAVKRAVDVVIALSALVICSPVFALVAIAISLDRRGPVLFRQRRSGFNGREFVIFKFRTMTVLEDGPHIIQANRNDSRVTKVGYFLRRTSIDELPQLVNVLKGDMSIVGPRPHALAHDNEYNKLIANYAYRHHVKPGMTGWAQVNGYRGETSELERMVKRINMDLWYINNWSFLLDLRIIFRTGLEVLRCRGAY